MDIFRWQFIRKLADYGVGLADLLAFQPGTLQHVVEIGVTADIQLAGTFNFHAAIMEQLDQITVYDRRPDLALNVVTNDRQPGGGKFGLPFGAAGNEDRNTVDHRAASLDDLISVEAHGFLAANGR